jgi:hypothetical protein
MAIDNNPAFGPEFDLLNGKGNFKLLGIKISFLDINSAFFIVESFLFIVEFTLIF